MASGNPTHSDGKSDVYPEEDEKLRQPIEIEREQGDAIMHEMDAGVAERYVQDPREEDHGTSSHERDEEEKVGH